MGKIQDSGFEGFVIEHLKAGTPTRQISELLKEKGVNIGFSTISVYANENGIKKEVINQYEAGQKIEGLSEEAKDVLIDAFDTELARFYKAQSTFMNDDNGIYPVSLLKSLKALFDVLSKRELDLTENAKETLSKAFENQLAILKHAQKNDVAVYGESNALKTIQTMLN